MNANVERATVEFRQAARTFVAWVDTVTSGPPEVPSLLALHQGLLDLQAAVLDLPPVTDDDFNDAADALKARVKHNPHVQQALATRLPITGYGLVFDPLDEGDPAAIRTTLDDDLADVYWDVTDGIALSDAGYYGDAVWHWRFSYFTHCGRHAVHAQTAIWQYLADNYDWE